MPKSLDEKFEDELADLVDQFLIDGLDIPAIESILKAELGSDLELRRQELVDWNACVRPGSGKP